MFIIDLEDPWYSFYVYVLENTNLEHYKTFSEESKRKLTEKVTINICYTFAPKRDYGITKAEVRDFVSGVIEEISDNYDFFFPKEGGDVNG